MKEKDSTIFHKYVLNTQWGLSKTTLIGTEFIPSLWHAEDGRENNEGNLTVSFVILQETQGQSEWKNNLCCHIL